MLYLVDISCLLFQNTVTLFATVTVSSSHNLQSGLFIFYDSTEYELNLVCKLFCNFGTDELLLSVLILLDKVGKQSKL